MRGLTRKFVRKLVILGVILILIAFVCIWQTRNGGWVLLGVVGATLTLSPLIENVAGDDPAQINIVK